MANLIKSYISPEFKSIIIKFVITPMTLKYSQSDLKSQLIKQILNETTLFYSLVKKQAKNISFMSNYRLLIYDNNRKIIYYNNDYKNTPFRTNAPIPKNGTFTPLATSTFKNPNGTNEIQVRYTGKNVKGELETIEWNFICETLQLAKDWMKLLDEEKNKLMGLITGEKGGGFIHDTLIDAINRNRDESPPKETILKPEEQVIKTIPLQEQPDNIRNSRLSQSKKYDAPSKIEPQKKELQQSQGLEFSNLRENSMIRSSKNQNNESRLYLQASQAQKIESQSNIKQKEPSIIVSRQKSEVNDKKKGQNDWNLIFLKNPHESTILEFEQAALDAFRVVWDRDGSVLADQRRVYESDGLKISVCNAFTEEARLLKREFRNYHFILESCKAKLVVGVPLTCLLEWQGVVALVKAPIPYECQEVRLAKVFNDLRELQRYTRVNNTILEKGVIYDATEVYGMNGEKRLIYLDNIVEYLPLHVDEQYSKTSLRPEYLLDTVSQIIPGGEVKPVNRQEWKLLSGACEGLENCLKQLTLHLNNQQTLWCHALELKDIFHEFGVNFKYLPRIYNELSNKHVKKYLQTVMAAKVAKELINGLLFQSRKESRQANWAYRVEECIRKLIEGNNSSSSQIWKDLSIKFKKQYGIAFNNNELIGGFFLNSLVRLLRVNCDLSKLNKGKKIFKEEGIIGPGFVISVEPKSKIYNRFTTEFIEKIKYACKQEKKDEEIYDEIVNTLQLDRGSIPLEYSQGSALECILEYLSYYTPPKGLDPNAPLRNIPIYDDIFKETPSAFTLKLTKAYLFWCIKKEKGDDFKKGMENALKIADYWLEDTHLYHCSLYELLSDFYASMGNGEESINFMKQALSKCIRVCGAQSKQAGAKYYELGQRQLKVGHKKEALENFNKAKVNMQSNQNQTIKYPQLLMRLSALHLNNGNIEGCIEGALHAIRQFEEYDKKSNTAGLLTQGYKIKTFEVLSRAYEISGNREGLKEIAVLCSKQFNRSRLEWTFQQMLRICVAAVIFKYSAQKGEFFVKFIHKLMEQQKIDDHTALKQLMNLSESMIVMQRFISRFQHLEKIVAQGNSKRGYTQESKDFVLICKLLGGCVGEDYIQGLVSQKQYE